RHRGRLLLPRRGTAAERRRGGGGLIDIGTEAAAALGLGAALLAFKTGAATGERWPSRDALSRRQRGARDECDEPLAGVGAIALLAAEAARIDHENAVTGEASSGKPGKPMAHIFRQGRRRADIEAELDGARHLVDVLAARPR